MSGTVGVERIFQWICRIQKIEVNKRGKVRRAQSSITENWRAKARIKEQAR